MIGCPFNFIKYSQEVLINSGRGFFHRGHYQSCIQQHNLKYALVQLGSGGIDTSIFVGLCLPRKCTDAAISKSLDSALKIVGMPLEVFSIQSNADSYIFPLNWLSYLTIFILLTILVLVFAATIRSYDRRPHSKYLQCFNIRANLKHFKIRQNEPLNAWDGIRSLSMLWVIIGHSFSFFLNAGVQNITHFDVPSTKPFFLIIQGGLLSVDIFLALGGFFLAFVMLRHQINGKVCLMGILQRALRIWPAYLISMMFYYSLFMRTGSGPFWQRAWTDVKQCSTMWRQIIFMSNFIENGTSSCMGWGWYLQIDFQLFVFGVFMIYLYSKKKWIFILLASLFSVGSLIFNYVFTYVEKIRIFTDIEAFINFETFMLNLYIKPYGRCVPYLMGFTLGLLYMEYKSIFLIDLEESKEGAEVKLTILGKLKQNMERKKWLNAIIEWSGIVLMALVVFIPRPLQLGYKWPQEVHSLYWSTSKPIFILGLLFSVLPSILSQTTFITSLLTPRIFTFIARISFCTYLVHLMVVYQYIYTRSYDIYYSIKQMFVIYTGLLPIIFVFGAMMTLFVEVPFSKLVKILTSEAIKERKGKISIEKEDSILLNKTVDSELTDDIKKMIQI